MRPVSWVDGSDPSRSQKLDVGCDRGAGVALDLGAVVPGGPTAGNHSHGGSLSILRTVFGTARAYRRMAAARGSWAARARMP
jgi:hypothetical protein